MRPQPFTLRQFVRESNRIEGIPVVRACEIDAHERLLAVPTLGIGGVTAFVYRVAGASLRRHMGMDVRVGSHQPPPGGPDIVRALDDLLTSINARLLSPWEAHHIYETLHPFMDGNGRSGRAIWLRMMGGIERAPLGFLHHWYYQSLANGRLSPSSGNPS